MLLHILDSTGREHIKEVPQSLFVPTMTKTLASPQHFAQVYVKTSTSKTILTAGAHTWSNSTLVHWLSRLGKTAVKYHCALGRDPKALQKSKGLIGLTAVTETTKSGIRFVRDVIPTTV